MQDDLRYIVRGAALGSVFGALAGWLYIRWMGPRKASSALLDRAGKPSASLDTNKVMRLGWSIVGVVRQLIELG